MLCTSLLQLTTQQTGVTDDHAYGLPIELLDKIFEEADLETQKACSLVCYVWLELSRRYLFDCIVIRSDTTFDVFRQYLKAHPHIGIHTRRIHLLGPDASRSPFQKQEYPRIDLGMLLDIVTYCPKTSSIHLKTVILANTPGDAKSRLAALAGPIRLAEFSLIGCPLSHHHSPTAVAVLLQVFEARRMQIQLSTFCTSSQDEHADAVENGASVVTRRWPFRHESICLQGIISVWPTPFKTLTEHLAPGSLKRLHLDFINWSHLHEMTRLFQFFGESIIDFTITFAHALNAYKARHHERESNPRRLLASRHTHFWRP